MQNKAAALCLVVAVSATCPAQQTGGNTALVSLVESERAFAATSLKIGARSSFMMYFADDAIVFRPHPVNYKTAMKDVPMPKNPLETSLTWEPIWADVSMNGDLGYTTGPSLWTDHSQAKRPPYHGFYFSFWKKQPNGEWKVVFDVGTELPGPFEGSRAFRSPLPGEHVGKRTTVNAEQARSELKKAEIEFCAAIRSKAFSNASDDFLDKQVRIHRQREWPIVGIDSARKYFALNPYLSNWELIGCDAASSGDLGYTYGSYVVSRTPGESNAEEKGYYLHGWKRDAADRWKLVAEITSPLPAETPKAKQ